MKGWLRGFSRAELLYRRQMQFAPTFSPNPKPASDNLRRDRSNGTPIRKSSRACARSSSAPSRPYRAGIHEQALETETVRRTHNHPLSNVACGYSDRPRGRLRIGRHKFSRQHLESAQPAFASRQDELHDLPPFAASMPEKWIPANWSACLPSYRRSRFARAVLRSMLHEATYLDSTKGLREPKEVRFG